MAQPTKISWMDLPPHLRRELARRVQGERDRVVLIEDQDRPLIWTRRRPAPR
jgi:hypothetical protein